MKRLFTILLSLVVLDCSAQPVGDWLGKLNMGNVSLRLVLHIKDTNGQLTATMDSPDQGAYGIEASNVFANADSVDVAIGTLNLRYSGKMESSEKINGTFQQGVTKLPLTLERMKGPVAQPKRPQTPKSPFPYKSEDVSFSNADKSLQFGATITIPEGKGPFPALLLITGSGPQNRDEEIMGHKPFAVIADHLTKNGYAVLRVDDRGVGNTSGDFESAVSKDFADDAEAAINYLKGRKDVDTKKIGLLGHSEGGLIAEMIAAKRKDIDFVILLAAPGINAVQLMTEQNIALLEQSGLSKEDVQAYAALYKNIATSAAKATDSAVLAGDITSIVKAWVANTNATTVATTTAITDESSMYQRINGMIPAFSSSWIRQFLAQDAQVYLPKIKAKVLALNGSKDIQVISSSNLEGISTGLAKGNNKNVAIKELQGLNHLFQSCNTCTVQEYGQLEETVAPIVLQTITTWLNNEVK